MSSRPARPGTTGHASKPGRRGGGRKQGEGRGRPASSGEALKAKEEEYRRVNAELEAKTAALVQEAEELMKGNLSILSELETSTNSRHSPERGADKETTHQHAPGPLLIQRPKSTSAHPPRIPLSTAIPRPHTSTTNPPHPHPPSRKPPPKRPAKTTTDKPSGDPAPPTDPPTLGLEGTVRLLDGSESAGMESALGLVPGGQGLEMSGYHGDDILPEAAEDMGKEALVRFMKAKLRVMQEELDRVCQEGVEKDKLLAARDSKLGEVTEQHSKLQRSHQSAQAQLDRYRQNTESLRSKCEGLEAQLVSLRKEVDGMKSTQKKAASSHSALEVRLNRAMEEAERYKTALQKARADTKDSTKQERQRIEQLLAENKQLERQKSELIAAFKKQMKLIDILKRQKMHIEAAKMLSFTEEEFVKALDWGTS